MSGRDGGFRTPQGADAGFICDASDGEVSVMLGSSASGEPPPGDEAVGGDGATGVGEVAATRSEPSAAVATADLAAAGEPATVRGSRGSVTVNRLPRPGPLSTVTVPPCMSTMDRTIARPRPLPLPRASLARDPR